MKTKAKPSGAMASPDQCLDYAQTIAVALYQKHFAKDKPDVKWEVYPDLFGVLQQIDNMVQALTRERVAVEQPGHDRPASPLPWFWMYHRKNNGPGERFGLCTEDGKTDVLLATDTEDGRVIIEISEADADLLLKKVNAP